LDFLSNIKKHAKGFNTKLEAKTAPVCNVHADVNSFGEKKLIYSENQALQNISFMSMM
jgi:hypothetical protein